MIKNTKTLPSNSKKPRPDDCRVHMRLTREIYNILKVKSLERKMGNNPNKYIRYIIEEHLRADDEKMNKKAIVNLFYAVKKIEKILNFLCIVDEKKTYLHYLSHPETVNDDAIIAAAENKMKSFYRLLASIKLGEGHTVFEEIISDIIERG